MRKTISSLLAFCLLLCALSCFAFSCKDNAVDEVTSGNEDATTTSSATEEEGEDGFEIKLSEYKVIYPEGAGALVSGAASRLRDVI